MIEKKSEQNYQNEFDRMRRMRDLESPLESVMEQDGIVLLTPAGIKHRARRLKKVKKNNSVFKYTASKRVSDSESEVEEMDLKAIACSVDADHAPEAVCLSINYQPHIRSEYVVSLQECFVGQNLIRERIEPSKQMMYADQYSPESFSRDTLTAAALVSEVEPWMVRDQIKLNSENGLYQQVKKVLRKIGGSFLRPVTISHGKQSYIEPKALTKDIIPQQEPLRLKPVAYQVNVKSFIVGILGLAFLAIVPAFALTTYKTFAGQSGAIEQKSNEAAMALASISIDEDLNFSIDQMSDASIKFKQAQKMLDESSLLAASAAAVNPEQYRGAKALLEVGEKSSEAGKVLALGFAKVFDDERRSLIERIKVLGTYAKAALPLLEDAENASVHIRADHVPEKFRQDVKMLPEKLNQATLAVRELRSVSEALVKFLGDGEFRNYLLVFQNDSELRPSGGFMGSVAEVRIVDGELQSVYVPEGGPYDLKSQLTQRVQSPEPMHLINPLWQFQDANWFADFYKSAEKINWFWSKSGQPTVDGIVAVNASFMEDVLRVIGPIEMPEYGKVIDADNFYTETQKSVELEYDKKENKPKKFIGDMFNKLLVKVKDMSKEEWLRLAAAASEGLNTKDIQVAMFRPEEQEFVQQFGWGGTFKETDGDFLAIVEANIAGQKTDRVVQESVLHEVNIAEDGTIENKVHLNRVHKGVKNELFYGVRNVSYIRFYLPKGVEVIKAEGFLPPPENLFKKPLASDLKDPALKVIEETAKPGPGDVWIAEEDGLTVVGGWLQLDPGRSQDVIISYSLPFTVQDILNSMDEDLPEPAKREQARAAYLMLYTSQSGKARELTQRIVIDSVWDMEWRRSETDKDIMNVFWDRDRVSAMLLKKRQYGSQ